MAQEIRYWRKTETKCARRAWYWISPGGRIDQDVVVGTGEEVCSVGGGGRQWRQRPGKSRVRGS